MQLMEYEAKEIFAQSGISVPKGITVKNSNDAEIAFEKIGANVVIKPMGIKKRGKLGLVKFAYNTEDARKAADELLGRKVNEKVIDELLVEQKLPIDKEFYIAITIDSSIGKPVLVISRQGGIEIEDVTEGIAKIDVMNGLGETARNAINNAFGEHADRIYAIAEKLYSIFNKYDAETVEINPLGLSEGELVALDAVLSIDDNALFRHKDLEEKAKARKYKTDIEREMGEAGWSYIDMDGDIATISSGAGMSMATMDMIMQDGGKPSNFLDMAQVDGDGLYKAFGIMRKKAGMKVIFVNLFAGLNRCDLMADGIVRAVKEHIASAPVVARLVGNMEDEGTKTLKEVGIENIKSLEEAVAECVKVAKGGAQ